jgi:HAMP domain-containing protein/putative methionine-R-sulfoxide reductase with GAF domain
LKFRSSLTFRIQLVASALVVAWAVILTWYCLLREKQTIEDHFDQRVADLSNELARIGAFGVQVGDAPLLARQLSDFIRYSDVQDAAFIDHAGQVLALRTRGGSKTTVVAQPPPKGVETRMLGVAHDRPHRLLAVTVPIARTGAPDPLDEHVPAVVGSAVAVFSLEKVDAVVRDTLLVGLLISLGGLIALLVVLHLVIRATTRPLIELVRATEAVAAGDFSFHLPSSGVDEVGALTNAFGRMARDLKQSLEESRARFLSLQATNAALNLSLERIGALREIDRAISGSLDLRVTMNVLLDQATAHLGVDAADILLVDPHTLTLEFAAGRGFRTKALRCTRLQFGQGHAGLAALERKLVAVPDLGAEPSDFARSPLLPDEGFVAYYAVPFVSKGRVLGVLEAFHRSTIDETREWLDFLETLAGQAAVAIESAALVDDLRRSNTEQIRAYDSTIEGWSRALDLRDKETEGHSQRVTTMSVRLGQALGLRGEDIVHLRRGALLHDIGKMGIPDNILLKPGPLTDHEWVIMKKHPVFALELLAPIGHLRNSIDIPYCHHEKWDGSGYPRGLKGEQIPLSARLFAVVDAWDAMTSDRPYRAAMPPEKARQILHEGSATHFDPIVVQLFLDNLDHAGRLSAADGI